MIGGYTDCIGRPIAWERANMVHIDDQPRGLAQSMVEETLFGDTHIRSLALGWGVYLALLITILIHVRMPSSVAFSSDPHRANETELKR